MSDSTNKTIQVQELNLIRNHLCHIRKNLNYFQTIFDRGAISLPGVLKDFKKILKLIFNGRHSRFIQIRRIKDGHWKNCLPVEILILIK